ASGLIYQDEWPHAFVQNFRFDAVTGLMRHHNPAFHSFTWFTRKIVTRAATPPILVSKRVFDGFRAARPNAIELQNKWFTPVALEIPGYTEQAYGLSVIFTIFQ